MTVFFLYTVRMNTHFFAARGALYNLNSATAIKGCVWLIVIFALCFCGVHLLRLAKMGWDSTAQKQQRTTETADKRKDPAPPPPTPPTPQPEPVYFIVERKKKRAKNSYEQPKEIRFK